MNRVWATVFLAGVGTFAMRASFLVAARHLVDVPPAVTRILRQIPPAALASLVLPALLRPGGEFGLLQARLAAGLVAAVVAWKTRSTGITLVVGMALVSVLEAL